MTAAIGKWGLGHFGTPGDPNQQGFDLFYGFNCQVHAHNHYPRFLWRNRQKELLAGNTRELNGETYSQDRFVEEGLAFITEHKDRPFFLYLPFAVPHLSIQVPEESLQLYQNLPEEDYEHRGYLPHPFPRAGYAAMVTRMDEGIGKILDRLEQLELDEHTIIIFTSDNGPTYDRLGGSDSDFFHSSGGLRGRKGSLYEGGIRVPLVVRWPGRVSAGETRTMPSAFWDLMPTLLELANVEAPDGIDGVSLAKTLMDGRASIARSHLYWEFPAYGGQQAIRAGKWKGIRRGLIGESAKLEMELYDLERDPGESSNVAGQHPEVVENLSTLMRVSRTSSEKFPIPILDADPTRSCLGVSR